MGFFTEYPVGHAPGYSFGISKSMESNTPEIPIPKKPGPNGEPKWAEKVVKGIVVGRNKVIVCPEEVVHQASLGCTDREIAAYFDVHENTLRYNFKEYLTKGRHQLRTTLRQAQLRVALDGNPTMLIFLGKVILSQREYDNHTDDVRPLPWTDDVDSGLAEPIEQEDSDAESI